MISINAVSLLLYAIFIDFLASWADSLQTKKFRLRRLMHSTYSWSGAFYRNCWQLPYFSLADCLIFISNMKVQTDKMLILAGLSTSSSSMKPRMKSLDSSLSPESMQSFSFSSSLLLSLLPLSSSSLSSLSLLSKVYFELRLFLSI